MRVWVCMLYQKWAHAQINGCVRGQRTNEAGAPLETPGLYPKATHPNCGWFTMEKTE